MATAPLCKTCKTHHWYREPHVWPKMKGSTVTPTVTVVTQDVTIPYVKARNVTRPVTRGVRVTEDVTLPPSVTTGVTQPKINFTPMVTEQMMIEAAVTESHECPICGLLHHRAKTTAERSKAYRGRKA